MSSSLEIYKGDGGGSGGGAIVQLADETLTPTIWSSGGYSRTTSAISSISNSHYYLQTSSTSSYSSSAAPTTYLSTSTFISSSPSFSFSTLDSPPYINLTLVGPASSWPLIPVISPSYYNNSSSSSSSCNPVAILQGEPIVRLVANSSSAGTFVDPGAALSGCSFACQLIVHYDRELSPSTSSPFYQAGIHVLSYWFRCISPVEAEVYSAESAKISRYVDVRPGPFPLSSSLIIDDSLEWFEISFMDHPQSITAESGNSAFVVTFNKSCTDRTTSSNINNSASTIMVKVLSVSSISASNSTQNQNIDSAHGLVSYFRVWLHQDAFLDMDKTSTLSISINSSNYSLCDSLFDNGATSVTASINRPINWRAKITGAQIIPSSYDNRRGETSIISGHQSLSSRVLLTIKYSFEDIVGWSMDKEGHIVLPVLEKNIFTITVYSPDMNPTPSSGTRISVVLLPDTGEDEIISPSRTTSVSLQQRSWMDFIIGGSYEELSSKSSPSSSSSTPSSATFQIISHRHDIDDESGRDVYVITAELSDSSRIKSGDVLVMGLSPLGGKLVGLERDAGVFSKKTFDFTVQRGKFMFRRSGFINDLLKDLSMYSTGSCCSALANSACTLVLHPMFCQKSFKFTENGRCPCLVSSEKEESLSPSKIYMTSAAAVSASTSLSSIGAYSSFILSSSPPTASHTPSTSRSPFTSVVTSTTAAMVMTTASPSKPSSQPRPQPYLLGDSSISMHVGETINDPGIKLPPNWEVVSTVIESLIETASGKQTKSPAGTSSSSQMSSPTATSLKSKHHSLSGLRISERNGSPLSISGLVVGSFKIVYHAKSSSNTGSVSDLKLVRHVHVRSANPEMRLVDYGDEFKSVTVEFSSPPSSEKRRQTSLDSSNSRIKLLSTGSFIVLAKRPDGSLSKALPVVVSVKPIFPHSSATTTATTFAGNSVFEEEENDFNSAEEDLLYEEKFVVVSSSPSSFHDSSYISWLSWGLIGNSGIQQISSVSVLPSRYELIIDWNTGGEWTEGDELVIGVVDGDHHPSSLSSARSTLDGVGCWDALPPYGKCELEAIQLELTLPPKLQNGSVVGMVHGRAQGLYDFATSSLFGLFSYESREYIWRRWILDLFGYTRRENDIVIDLSFSGNVSKNPVSGSCQDLDASIFQVALIKWESDVDSSSSSLREEASKHPGTPGSSELSIIFNPHLLPLWMIHKIVPFWISNPFVIVSKKKQPVIVGPGSWRIINMEDNECGVPDGGIPLDILSVVRIDEIHVANNKNLAHGKSKAKMLLRKQQLEWQKKEQAIIVMSNLEFFKLLLKGSFRSFWMRAMEMVIGATISPASASPPTASTLSNRPVSSEITDKRDTRYRLRLSLPANKGTFSKSDMLVVNLVEDSVWGCGDKAKMTVKCHPLTFDVLQEIATSENAHNRQRAKRNLKLYDKPIRHSSWFSYTSIFSLVGALLVTLISMYVVGIALNPLQGIPLFARLWFVVLLVNVLCVWCIVYNLTSQVSMYALKIVASEI